MLTTSSSDTPVRLDLGLLTDLDHSQGPSKSGAAFPTGVSILRVDRNHDGRAGPFSTRYPNSRRLGSYRK